MNQIHAHKLIVNTPAEDELGVLGRAVSMLTADVALAMALAERCLR
jgi:hypothetical protein